MDESNSKELNHNPKFAVVAGGSGGIGQAFVEGLLEYHENLKIFATYRSDEKLAHLSNIQKQYPGRLITTQLCAEQEADFKSLANRITDHTESVEFFINCIGHLHSEKTMPEKKLEDLNPKQMIYDFQVNACTTALFAKSLFPFFKNSQSAVFCSLSARVGSIGDNQTGGWYSYRASKAALNMIIKNIAIEFDRKRCNTKVMAIHPGTVITNMTEPFSSRSKYQLHRPHDCYHNLISAINTAIKMDSGQFLDWKGEPIEW